MGQCCKCGRETQHAYEYYTADVFSEYGVVTYENMEKRTAFLDIAYLTLSEYEKRTGGVTL